MIREVVLRGSSTLAEQGLLGETVAFLRSELGCEEISARDGAAVPDVCISLRDWAHDAVNVSGFDRLFEQSQRAGPFRLILTSNDWAAGAQQALELLTRYQRLLPLPASLAGLPQVARVLAAHRLMHPLERASVRASYEHALDGWRWLLRLSPTAELGLQLAALFHDVGLIESEIAAREGQTAVQTDDALGSIRLACRALEPVSLPIDELARMVALLGGSGVAPAREAQLLLDADGLSFLSLGAWRYLQDFGLQRTRAKLGATLDSMSDVATCLALMTRQSRVIAELLGELLGHCAARESGIRELGAPSWNTRAPAT